MGGLWLCVSVSLLVIGSLRASRVLAGNNPDRLWIALAVGTLVISTSLIVASALNAVSVGGLLFVETAVMVVVLLLARRIRRGRSEVPFVSIPQQAWSGAEVAVLLTILITIALSALRQGLSPVAGFDERMYHASRVAYWMQHQSVFWYPTHNERQVAFPWLGEAFFLWPLVFVKDERIGRLFFWLCYPIATWGIASVCRALGLKRITGLMAAAVFAATPTLLIRASSIKADLWLMPFLLGAAYFVVRAGQSAPNERRQWFRVGCFMGLAIGVKTTALAVFPGVILAMFLSSEWRRAARHAVASAGGAGLTVALSGFLYVAIENVRAGNGPLGSPGIVQIVQPDYSIEQVCTHAARLPIFLFELPELPVDSSRRWIEARVRRVANDIGANRRLPQEDSPGWPGSFEFHADPTASRYSMGGMFWLPCLAAGLCVGVLQVVRSWPRIRMSSAPMLAVAQLPLLVGVVFMVRWMQSGPERFWLGAFAMSVPVTAWVVERIVRGRLVLTGVAVVVVVATVGPSIKSEARRVNTAIEAPYPPEILNEPYEQVVGILPRGARILLFGEDSTRDYPLFAPTAGYTNRVVSWGRDPFEARRADDLLSRHGITHIIIDGKAVKFLKSLRALPEWLSTHPEFKEVQLQGDSCRLLYRSP